MNPLAYLDTAISLGFVSASLRDGWINRAESAVGDDTTDIRALLMKVGAISVEQDAAILAALQTIDRAPAARPPVRDAVNVDAPTLPVHHGLHFEHASAAESRTLLRVGSDRSIGARSGNEPGIDLRGREIAAHDEGPKYVRGQLLGRGGMGEVCLAVDRDIRRDVAIKTLLEPDRTMVRQRFIEEAQVTGQLEHPNIVPIHELGMDDDGRPFLVMKRVRGRSLADVLEAVRKGDTVLLRTTTGRSQVRSRAMQRSTETDRRAGRASSRLTRSSARVRNARAGMASHDPTVDAGGALDAPTMLMQLLGMFLKVCDALAYAHARGVIHRDLKPENVMVGEFGEVLVMDWGLAKVLAGEERAPVEMISTLRSSGIKSGTDEQIAHTVDGAVAGTPAYMPPEQARGEIALLDARSDVYSLGAMLYEIVSCNVPVEAPSVYTLLARVAKGEIEPPSARSRAPWSVPRELEAVVLKAMSHQPRDRYADALMLKADVEAYLSGRTTQAADYSPWQVIAKWARRNKVAVIGAAATLLALIGGIVAAVVLRVDAELAAERDRIATEQRTREQAEQEARESAQADARAQYETGNTAFIAAAQVPFNPAAPQEHFQATLPAWMQMGAAYQAYPADPDGAPPGWRETLTARGDALFDKATQVGDWAIASVIVEAATQWGAIDIQRRADRLQHIDTVKRERAAIDRQRLDDTLDIIARADMGENMGARLPPGELTERARKVARLSGPELVHDVIGMLATEAYPIDSIRRRFLIETLGWAGDAHVEYDGLTAPAVIKREVAKLTTSNAHHDESTAWAWAAARLVLSDAITFDELGAVLIDLSTDVSGAVGLVELQRIVETVEAVMGWEKIDTRDTERLEELVDACTFLTVSCAQSGTDFTRYMIELAQRGDQLTPRQLACVYGFMGLYGDREPPDPLESNASVVTVLLDAFADLPDDLWLANRPAPGVDDAAWKRVRAKMLSAPINLWRLDETSIADELLRRRNASGQFSVYSRMTDLAFTLMPETGDEPTTAIEYEQRAKIRAARLDYAGALADYGRAIELNPDSSSAYGNRAIVKQALDDYSGALDDYAKAIELDPEAIAPLVNRGNLHLSAGHANDALADLNAALEIDPASANALDARGEAYRMTGKFQLALDDLNRAIEIVPTFANAYYHRGAVFSSVGQHDDALRDMNKALELAPNRPMYYVGRGMVKTAMNEFQSALLDFNRALEMDPGNLFAHVNRATARVAMRDLEGALRDYDTVLQVRPNDYQCLGNKAMTLALLDRKDEAAELFERAIKLAPAQAKEQLRAAREHFMNR